jgi:peptidoglycan hydrolase-like protein with peptidoglycan-binding domain
MTWDHSATPGAPRRLHPGIAAVITGSIVAALVLGTTGARAATIDADGPSGPTPTTMLPRLGPGDEGSAVLTLQTELAAAGFYVHEANGVYDERTGSAVVAFHKYVGTPRTDVFTTVDWHLLRNLPDPGLPDRRDAEDFVEVDISRQILFVIRDGSIQGILPVSTGGGHTYWSARNGWYARASTPRGDFTLLWNQTGWATDRATGWSVYKYWAFTGFYGIHGYPSVPVTPASHGCVRLNLWDADWIEHHLFVGMSVHIWDEPPVVEHVAVEGPATIA